MLAAPTHPDADFRVSVDQLERALAILRPRFDEVIVDCGSRLDPRSLWMLEQASTHVFVIFPEIAALRATSVLLGFLAETATLRAKTHFVVNHIFPKELLKTRDVENLLRSSPAAEIPYTEVDMIRAVNEGVPVVTSRPGITGGPGDDQDGAGDRRHPDGDGRQRTESGSVAEASSRAAHRASWCRRRDSNPHVPFGTAGFKPAASAIPPLRPGHATR